MQYSTILALLSAPLVALAQDGTSTGPNAFIIPTEGLSAAAGEPLELNWDPTTEGTVSLVLRSGSSNDLNEGTEIASGIDNSGSYTWTPAEDITRGSDYTVEIVDDEDPSNVNYTPPFVLDSDNTVASQTGIVSLGQPTTTPDLSTAQPTGDATSLIDGETTVSAPELTSSGASNAQETTTATLNTATTSVSATDAEETDSEASSTAEETGASASEDLQAPEQSEGAAPRNAVYVGAMGALALGAFAL